MRLLGDSLQKDRDRTAVSAYNHLVPSPKNFRFFINQVCAEFCTLGLFGQGREVNGLA